MTTTFNIARFDGDGIGPEILAEAVKVLDAATARRGVSRSQHRRLKEDT